MARSALVPLRAVALFPLLKLLFVKVAEALPFHEYLKAAPLFRHGPDGYYHPNNETGGGEASMAYYLISAAILVALGGAFAGLTIAYG
jgi:hypothetical protein